MVIDKFTYELNGKDIFVEIEQDKNYDDRFMYSLYTDKIMLCYRLFENGLKRYLEESPILNTFSELTAK